MLFRSLGWPTRRIIAQVMGESLAIGIVGGAAGVGLGFAGAAIITAVAPTLTATIAGSTGGPHVVTGGAGGPVQRSVGPMISHTVAVPMSASVTVAALAAAVALAIVGGLLAGTFGSWRISRLRPADALGRVA